MKSFAQFLEESAIPRDQTGALAALDKYLAGGQIVKGDYETLKGIINRHLQKDFETNFFGHYTYAGNWANLADADKWAHDIGGFYGMNDLKSIPKKMVKWDSSTVVYKTFKKLFDFWYAVYEKMETLKGMIVTATQLRQAAKDVEAKKLKSYNPNVLKDALKTHRAEFIKMATESAKKLAEKLKDELGNRSVSELVQEKYPRNSRTQADTKAVQLILDRYSPFVDRGTQKMTAATIKAGIDSYIKGSEAEYDDWVTKMMGKIGTKIVDAEANGHPWESSTLTVTLEDGSKQVWTTKIIVNVSKYGKLFNQFPSRQR